VIIATRIDCLRRQTKIGKGEKELTMKVEQVMTTNVASCRPDTNLAVVAQLMWNRDCGFVPVVDADGAVVGVVTDRDICIATATRGLPPQRIAASEAMTGHPRACLPNDSVTAALGAMKQFQVHRLPVIDETGTLKGVVSLNDLVILAQEKKEPSAADVLSAMAGICAHRSVEPVAV
jgi:CBS domain-containing protein